MKKFIIRVETEWCGEDNAFAAIAEEESELWQIADELAYENFNSFDGWDSVADEMFPDTEIGDLTDEEREQIDGQECNYYSSSIEEVDENDEEQLEEFNSLDLIYDKNKEDEKQEIK